MKPRKHRRSAKVTLRQDAAKRKPRTKSQSATRLDTAATPSPTIAERQHAALLGGQQPKSVAQAVAAAWRWASWVKRNPHVKPSPLLAQFEAAQANVTTAFINRAMSEWRPDLLKELAREMKRGGIPEKWEPDKAAWCLLEASRAGEVNLSELQREAQARKVLAQHVRTWRRKAHKLRLPVRSAGHPKK